MANEVLVHLIRTKLNSSQSFSYFLKQLTVRRGGEEQQKQQHYIESLSKLCWFFIVVRLVFLSVLNCARDQQALYT